MTIQPARADIWLVDFDPVVGHEQGKKPRPAVIVSDDRFNVSVWELVIVVPTTSTQWNLPYHVPIDRVIKGQTRRSYIMCEQIRCVSFTRLMHKLDVAKPNTMIQIGLRLRPLLP